MKPADLRFVLGLWMSASAGQTRLRGLQSGRGHASRTADRPVGAQFMSPPRMTGFLACSLPRKAAKSLSQFCGAWHTSGACRGTAACHAWPAWARLQPVLQVLQLCACVWHVDVDLRAGRLSRRWRSRNGSRRAHSSPHQEEALELEGQAAPHAVVLGLSQAARD